MIVGVIKGPAQNSLKISLPLNSLTHKCVSVKRDVFLLENTNLHTPHGMCQCLERSLRRRRSGHLLRDRKAHVALGEIGKTHDFSHLTIYQIRVERFDEQTDQGREVTQFPFTKIIPLLNRSIDAIGQLCSTHR